MAGRCVGCWPCERPDEEGHRHLLGRAIDSFRPDNPSAGQPFLRAMRFASVHVCSRFKSPPDGRARRMGSCHFEEGRLAAFPRACEEGDGARYRSACQRAGPFPRAYEEDEGATLICKRSTSPAHAMQGGHGSRLCSQRRRPPANAHARRTGEWRHRRHAGAPGPRACEADGQPNYSNVRNLPRPTRMRGALCISRQRHVRPPPPHGRARGTERTNMPLTITRPIPRAGEADETPAPACSVKSTHATRRPSAAPGARCDGPALPLCPNTHATPPPRPPKGLMRAVHRICHARALMGGDCARPRRALSGA